MSIDMSIEIYLAYVLATIAVVVVPGPTSLLVATQTIAYGRPATLPLVLGVFGGDTIGIFLSIIGIGAVLATSALWFGIVKWAGVVYLIYLGGTMWFGGSNSPSLDKCMVNKTVNKDTINHSAKKSSALFWHAFIVTLFNPKGIIFFVAFLPQFVNPAGHVVGQLTILAVTFIVLGSVNAFLYSIFANRLSQFMTNEQSQQRMNIIGGAALIAAGIWAATIQRV